jgi:hypothetical protein
MALVGDCIPSKNDVYFDFPAAYARVTSVTSETSVTGVTSVMGVMGGLGLFTTATLPRPKASALLPQSTGAG